MPLRLDNPNLIYIIPSVKPQKMSLLCLYPTNIFMVVAQMSFLGPFLFIFVLNSKTREMWSDIDYSIQYKVIPYIVSMNLHEL